MDILKGIRPLDYVLTAALVALAAVIGVGNVNPPAGAKFAHPMDTQSALMIPVFVLAVLPILWRRRNILAAIGVSFAVLAASVLAFGWVTRCGFGLPLAIVMAYAVARFAGSRQNQVIGLVGVLALQIVILMEDSSTGGLGALGVSLPATAVAYGLGLFVQSRAGRTVDGPTLPIEHAEYAQA
jgi:phosphotransferase system  glucose/maltose/N-acetylglucosamine-specific IIC component